MKKISVKGSIKDKDRINLLCPYCGCQSQAALFQTQTSLCLYSIPVKKINDRYQAVCLNCKHSFNVEPDL